MWADNSDSIITFKGKPSRGMKQHQFENQLDIGQFDFFQPEEEGPSTKDLSGPSPNSLQPHQDPLQLTQFLSQLPLNGSVLKTRRQKNLWTPLETQHMLELHNELGNKWSMISKQMPGKSENDIKNHFFSQLRMSLRFLNKLLMKPHLKKQQTIKPLILFKISNICQEQFNKDSKVSEDLIQQAMDIKRNLFNFLIIEDHIKKQKYMEIVKELRTFIRKTSKGCKGRAKNSTEESFSQQDVGQYPYSSFSYEAQSIKHNSEERKEVGLIKEEIIRPEDSTELIARPSFCLQNPFQTFQFGLQKEGSWDRQMRPFEFGLQPEGDSFMSHFLPPYEFNFFEL